MASLPEGKPIEEECSTETIHCNAGLGARLRTQEIDLKKPTKPLEVYNK